MCHHKVSTMHLVSHDGLPDDHLLTLTLDVTGNIHAPCSVNYKNLDRIGKS